MINYNSDEVLQYIRQYEMFSSSLKLIPSIDERNAVIKQLDRLEEKIIKLTNNIYENAYYSLFNKETYLLEEEKNRLGSLIELISNRMDYVNDRKNKHYELTGKDLDIYNFVGMDVYDTLKDRLKVIEKYSDNIKRKEDIDDYLDKLDSKLKLAQEKISINEALNVELEAKMIKCLDDVLKRYGLNLEAREDEIRSIYQELTKMLDIARENYETAKISSYDMVGECKKALADIESDYMSYREQTSILDLMKLYDKKCHSYQELLDKRTTMSELCDNILNKKIREAIYKLLKDQYSTILLEGQDISNYEKLLKEQEDKREEIAAIDNENNSDVFKNVLSKLIENENKRQAKLLEEKMKKQEEEKKRKAELEKRRQEEIMRRQKLIEDTRKKEIEKRTRQLLEEQKNTVLQSKPVNSSNVSFANMKKDIVNSKDKEPSFNKIDEKIDVPTSEYRKIEKDLFKEFNDKSADKDDELNFPKLKNNSLDKVELFKDEEYFPNIPM